MISVIYTDENERDWRSLSRARLKGWTLSGLGGWRLQQTLAEAKY